LDRWILTSSDFLQPYLRWTLPEFVVLVGPYAGGKSALAQMLAADFADVAGRDLGATASICAWEDADWRVRRNLERFAETREELYPTKGPEHRIVDLLHRVRHITRRPGELRSIEWYLERAELQVKRYNTRFFVFDPWNEADHIKERNDSETEYVNKMLRDLREFTAVHKVIMAVVTHVSGKSFTDEGKLKPFRVANAHGSSHFGKKCDRGFCVARTRALAGGQDRMIIRFDKAKDEESMGEIGDIAVAFDRERMDLTYDSAATIELRGSDGWALMTVFANHWQRYAALGWASFVLAKGDKVPAIAGAGGFKSATSDPTILASWAVAHPDANIGIATGRRSGIIVIDKDPRNGSHQTEARLAKQGKTFPETVEAESCQGGRHLYYGYDSRITRGGTGRLGPGLDIKTDGGYVVAPPSFVSKRVEKPGRYRWLRPPRGAALPKLPHWVFEALRPKPALPPQFNVKGQGDIVNQSNARWQRLDFNRAGTHEGTRLISSS
jgi:hypothetical protein